MTHIDEGTIHTWLDGQLDAGRAREVEMHVAQCSQCASAVAEARGLIAGSSRVLTALDDVPAGVMPKRAAPPRRKWQAAKWVTGIAAAAMLVLTLTELREPQTQAIFTATDSAPNAVTPRVAMPATRSATGAPTARSRPPLAREDRALAADEASRDASLSMPAAQKSVAAAPVPSNVPAASAAAGAGVEGAVNARLMEKREPVSVVDLAGCYRVADVPEIRRVGPSTASAAETREKFSARSRAPAMAKAAQPEPMSIVRLDTSETDQGFIVRAEQNVAAGWWRADGDSARVNLLTGEAFSVARQNRVPCR